MPELPLLYSLPLITLALLIAIVGHEIMHGYVAYLYGDSTAKEAGRLSLNPIVHIDPLGSILIPAILYLSGAPFLFGWAKPVPVEIRTVLYHGGYRAGMAVALAGVGYNFILAIIVAILIQVAPQEASYSHLLSFFLFQLLFYNVILGVFNLWPIPPLDGAKALTYLCMHFRLLLLPRILAKVEPFGMILLILLLATPLSKLFFLPAKAILRFLL